MALNRSPRSTKYKHCLCS